MPSSEILIPTKPELEECSISKRGSKRLKSKDSDSPQNDSENHRNSSSCVDDDDDNKFKRLKCDSPSDTHEEAKAVSVAESDDTSDNCTTNNGDANERLTENIKTDGKSDDHLHINGGSAYISSADNGEDVELFSESEEVQRTAREKQLKKIIANIVERNYKSLTVHEFESVLMTQIMHYFSSLHPSSHLLKKIALMQRKLDTVEDQYKKVMKQFYDMKYILRRLAEQKRTRNSNDLPCKAIRTVAVQVSAMKCRGGDLCPGTTVTFSKIPVSGTVNASRKSDNFVSGTQSEQQNGQTSSSHNPASLNTSALSTTTGSASAQMVSSEESKSVKNSQVIFSVAKTPSTSTAGKSNAQPPVIDLTDRDEGDGVTKQNIPSSSVSNSSGAKSSSPDSSRSSGVVILPSKKPLASDRVPIERVKLPPLPKSVFTNPNCKPPQPILKINKADHSGIMLSWTLKGFGPGKAELKTPIVTYQVFACQESNGTPKEWSSVGDVKALPLPMACTLSQFREGHRYHFIVRSVDSKSQMSDFSHPASILLVNKNQS